MNLKLYDFSWLLLEITLLKKKKKKIENMLTFQGVIYFLPGGIVKK